MSEAVTLICERPEAWPSWHRADVRRRVLRKYPYSIFYIVDHDVVVIVAVAHQQQRPGYWLARLK